ncbi:glycosyltransferase family 4 protein [Haladaptatus cibarius]|uniref:glycosyltransferase family 4 protein n=1 Tax=Haladaptatus cibarius TaxID=453847 RepID=UPI000679AF78|nr:glycosyltransferase family 4 protein [Haladaptatus cibarius]
MKIGLLNPTVLVRPDPKILAPRLAANGHDVVFYHPKKGRGNPPKGENITVKYYPARFVPKIRYTLPTPGFYRLLRDDIPTLDRFVIGDYLYPVCSIGALLGRRFGVETTVVVSNLVGIEWFYGNRLVDAVSKLYTHSVGRVTFAAADHIVGQGEYVRDGLTRFTSDRKTSVIPTGIDLDHYAPDATTAAEFDRNDAVELVYVGRLDPVKGVHYLLAAVEKLQERGNREYHLTLVGDGTKRAAYERTAEKGGIDGDVTFAGYQDDVRPFLIAADMFVLGSLAEGPPAVIREAQACETPVVSTNVGGVSDLVHGGVVVPPNDPNALADGIEQLAGTNLADCGRVAREFMVENFDVESMMAEYTALIADE